MHPMRRVLLIDDNEMFLKHLAYHLEQEPNLEIIATATDGTRAVAQALLVVPDVIVLDMNMPGVSGFETLPLLREALPDARLIALSSLHDPESVEFAYRCGADAFVCKAMMAEELVSEINRA